MGMFETYRHTTSSPFTGILQIFRVAIGWFDYFKVRNAYPKERKRKKEKRKILEIAD